VKILTLIYSAGIGGIERAAVNNAIGYKEFGHDSKVLVLGKGEERLSDLEEACVSTTMLIYSKKQPAQVFKEFFDWKPDIIHVHNFQDDLIPYINQIKSATTKVVETNVFSRPYYNKSYQVISLSMQLSMWGYWKYTSLMKGADYSPQVGIASNIVIHNKFVKPTQNDIQSFLRLQEIPKDAFVVGRLGQPIPVKWDTKLIDVIENTVNEDNKIYYLLVGVPENFKKKLNKKTPFIQSRVKIISEIKGDSNLSLYYHSLQCFAHIAKVGESFGYVLAEAMICKVPVITMLTPVKDNAQFDVVGHEYGGICTINTKAFINAVFKLYHNEDYRIQLSNNLNGWVEDRFSTDVIIPVQIKYYTSILQNAPIPKINTTKTIKKTLKLYSYRSFMIYTYLKILYTKPVYTFLKKLKSFF